MNEERPDKVTRVVVAAMLTIFTFASSIAGGQAQSSLHQARAIAMNPASEQACHKAQSLIEARKYAEALVCANEAVRLDRQNANYYDVRARVYEETKQFPQAYADVQKSPSLNSTSPEPYYRRACLQQWTGHSAQALKDSDTALKLSAPRWY